VELRPGACPSEGEIRFSREIPTTMEAKNKLLEEVTAFVGRAFVSDELELFRVRLSIDEGLQNAFVHGNAADPGKHIGLAVFETDAAWGVRISDEGPGFRPEHLPDPTTPSCLWQEHGRGVMIMCHYMDEVSYYDHGRTLRLVRMKGKKEG
jgi:serine/threonine-protein kinase RsbW